MSKTLISTLAVRIKRRIDYNPSETDTDLDNIVIDAINDVLKLIKQGLFDAHIFKDISASATLSTTASQVYVDISSVTDLDEIVKLSERTNDKPIDIISYMEFIARYPDPTANSANMPDRAALWNNRLYFGPTPSAVNTIYLEYVKLISDVTSSSSSPFESKYDPLVVAWAKEVLAGWLDSKDSASIAAAKAERKEWEEKLITYAARNIGMKSQSASRNDSADVIAPRVPESGTWI